MFDDEQLIKWYRINKVFIPYPLGHIVSQEVWWREGLDSGRVDSTFYTHKVGTALKECAIS